MAKINVKKVVRDYLKEQGCDSLHNVERDCYCDATSKSLMDCDCVNKEQCLPWFNAKRGKKV